MPNVVTVTAEGAPIVNKSDTLAFRVSAFKNEHIESTSELLAILPGFSINAEGDMYVNGIRVDKVTINGKPYFKDDFLLALNDLPAALLAFVEVTSTKTKSEAFANESGDENARTVNLVIDKSNFGHYSSNIVAAIGTNERFQLNGNLNSFGEKGQLNLLGRADNINNSNLFTGDINQSGNINTKQRYGANFSRELHSKIDMDGFFFSTTNKQINKEVSIRETFFPETNFFSRDHEFWRKKNNRAFI